MKNYIEEAKKINIQLTSVYDINCLQRYYINRKNNYVELHYMNGLCMKEFLDDRDKEKFDEQQRKDLSLLTEKMDLKSRSTIAHYSTMTGIYTVTGATLLALNNLGGIVWLAWTGYFLSKVIKPLKLKREMQLVGWIYDNKNDVNKIIREEVEAKMERGEITATTNNAPVPKYPTEEVQYSRSMYENGIDLCNIDELSNQQLRKLKRKVKAKRRNDINE